MRILIADDSEVMRNIVARALRPLEAEILHAEDGEQTLEVMRGADGPLDLVILDIHMRKLDGFQVMDAIAGDPALADTPVLLFTGDTDKRTLTAAAHSGAKGCLKKPFTMEQLYDKVSAILDR